MHRLVPVIIAIFHSYSLLAVTRGDQVYVHFDKDIYTAGDVIQYKAYLLNGGDKRNDILYFTLSAIGRPDVMNWRTNIRDNMAAGFLRLPTDLPEGIYEVMAYTHGMLNREVTFRHRILILNLSKTTPDSMLLTGPIFSRNSDQLPVNRISLKVPDRVMPCQKINLQIDNDSDDSVYLSVTVIKETLFTSVLDNNPKVQLNHPHGISDNECALLNESAGYTFSGTVSVNDIPLTGVKLLLAVQDSVSPVIIYSRSDSNGHFCFILNKFYDNKNLYVGIADTLVEHKINWSIDKKAANNALNGEMTVLDDKLKNELTQLHNLRLIDNVYFKSSDTVINHSIQRPVGFYFNPDNSVRLSDYVELFNFNEIDDNILPLVQFSVQGDKYRLLVFNYFLNIWSDDVLILLNGVPFSDLKYISLLGTKQIKKIDTYSSGIIIGGVSYDGALCIYTFDNNIPDPDILVFSNKVAPRGYVRRIENNISGRLPDFRDNLLFEPEVHIGGRNSNSVSFSASLLEGNYRVSVRGVNSKGDFVSIDKNVLIGTVNE